MCKPRYGNALKDASPNMGEVGATKAGEKRAPFANKHFALGGSGGFALAPTLDVGSADLWIVCEDRLDGPIGVVLLPSSPPNVFRRRRLCFDGFMLVTIANYAWMDCTDGYGAAVNRERKRPRLERVDPSGIVPLQAAPLLLGCDEGFVNLVIPIFSVGVQSTWVRRANAPGVIANHPPAAD